MGPLWPREKGVIMTQQTQIKKITGVGLLTALTVVLTLLGNMIAIGPVAINLSLLPIALGAIIYGPLSGLLLGVVNGVTVLLAPSTAIFLSHNVFFTIVTCLLKTGLAGLISGLIYKLLGKVNNTLSIVLAALIVPIVNTSIFCLFVFLFFYDLLLAGQGANAFVYFCLTIVGWNFIFEIVSTSVLSPTLIHVAKIIRNKQHTNA